MAQETTEHYLIYCLINANSRLNLLTDMANHGINERVTEKIVTHGNEALGTEENIKLSPMVQKYIKDTESFT